MNVETDKTARRRRKAQPRRVPSLIEQREAKPVVFGWGAGLNHREREALKERVALVAGIVLALILAGLLGWGWFQDNIAGPANLRAENNTPIAKVGNYTLREGFFKRYVKFERTQATNQLTQLQQSQAQLQADPKKNAAQLQQVQAQISSIQQQQPTIPTTAEDNIIDNQVLMQRAPSLGIRPTAKDINGQMIALERQAGSAQAFQTFMKNSGLTNAEFKTLITAQWLQTKVNNKLSAQVPVVQTKVRASHVLISSKKKSLAEKVYHMALNGSNFAALAKKYSTDTGSAKQGGDLGYFTRGAMVAPFANAAFSMKIGQIRLVKSQFGWHIIKVTGRERVHLTAQELSQAKQTAYQTWLQKQKGILHLNRYIDVTKLPGMATTATPQTSLPNSQIPPAVTQPQPKPKGKSSAPAKSKKK